MSCKIAELNNEIEKLRTQIVKSESTIEDMEKEFLEEKERGEELESAILSLEK